MTEMVTPRMRCVSRNKNRRGYLPRLMVTPRMRCVIRNHCYVHNIISICFALFSYCKNICKSFKISIDKHI